MNKSTKQSKCRKTDLGDEQSAFQDTEYDVSLENRNYSNNEEFQTPSKIIENTSYDFTKTFQNTTPRLCSTIRNDIIKSPNALNEKRKELHETTKVKEATKTVKTIQSRKSNRKSSLIRRTDQTQLQRHEKFLNEVRRLQNRTDFLVGKQPFGRLIREIMQNQTTEVTMITKEALECLQTSAEMYLTQRLHDAYVLTLHRGRCTLSVRDLQILCIIKDLN